MSTTAHPTHDSDSEDDPDYAPPADADSESSDEEREPVEAKPVEHVPTEEEENAKKRAREALWTEFQASVSAPPKTQEPLKKMVKITKKYLFAGKEVNEVVEVAEDSDDAKKWPVILPSESPNISLTVPPLELSDTAVTNMASSTSSTAPSGAPSEKKPMFGKRPGPRKSKTPLAALPSAQKAKKLTTLDKSAMDWNTHINTQGDSSVKDELEANRRGGGYLEKVEFLKRVDERKEEVIEASKPTKRRKL